ncbi:hypothetical protein LTS10_012386 [Elasticomyces elasticus]|nr:hypothetical protein LTS10_012386 [Elasticomyces elasticus]
MDGVVVASVFTLPHNSDDTVALRHHANPLTSKSTPAVIFPGGGAGVGAEIARSFVRSGSKAVIILGRRESVLSAAKKELDALGSSKILTYAADVVDEAGLNSAFTATEEAVGKVDIVVACAGFMPEVVLAAIAEIGDWCDLAGKAFEVNVRGLLLTFRAWMPHKSNGTPSFIYVNAGLSGYSPSKIAAASLIGHLQAENPDLHITNFHPGILETPMATKSQFAVSRGDISLPAGFAVWLASPAAAWTGGKFLWAHWDVDELIAMKDEIALGNELVMTLNGWPKQVDVVVKA